MVLMPPRPSSSVPEDRFDHEGDPHSPVKQAPCRSVGPSNNEPTFFGADKDQQPVNENDGRGRENEDHDSSGGLPSSASGTTSSPSLTAEASEKLHQAWREHKRDAVVVVVLCGIFVSVYFFNTDSQTDIDRTMEPLNELWACGVLGSTRGVLAVWLPVMTGSRKISSKTPVIAETEINVVGAPIGNAPNSPPTAVNGTPTTPPTPSSNISANAKSSPKPTLSRKALLWQTSFNFLYYGLGGFFFYFYFRTMTALFGPTPDNRSHPDYLPTILKKTAFDMFVVAPFWFVPFHQLGQRWRDNFGKFYPTFVGDKKLFQREGVITWWVLGYATEWIVVFPTVILAFAMPDGVQAPITCCFGILSVIFHSAVAEERG